MTVTCISGGHVVDPQNKRDSVGDVWIEDGRIVDPRPDATNVERIDANGCVVMAGAIDIHTHVAGANVSAARLLLPERYADVERPMDHWTGAPFDLFSTGALYAQMGFTLVVEPAVAPSDAVATHAELECIPYVDRASLSVIGNDDVLLGMLRDKASDAAIADYVAWSISTSRALGAKAINPGGVAALKANVRKFDLDDVVPEYGVSARDIGSKLRQALTTLGVPHPLHLHTCNLGLPGNVETALETIESAEGFPMHLAHLQFYGYGKEGDLGMSSGAVQLAEALAKHPNVTADVGQVMFGPTVTISSDALTQFNYRRRSKPKKFNVRDGDSNGGGVVPLHYRAKSKINVLQWAIGLELFLLIDDPSRVFLTTDHPNGGPFTAYPDLIALLMDHSAREAAIAALPEDVFESTTLKSLKREYSLTEIAIMTRAAPARLLGTTDRGHLGSGAVGDVAVYRDLADRAAMFRSAKWLFKDGHAIVKDGEVLAARYGRTLSLAPDYDSAITSHVRDAYDHRWGAPPNTFAVPQRLLRETSPFEVVPCRT
ncbi:MAG: formylmethanofuran dehydrogenase subunit A [Alphaproteobacteria bacterium]|nr:formylmethanofuran dehydrogenase subunit A [Alphaproteobacteria bacterium]